MSTHVDDTNDEVAAADAGAVDTEAVDAVDTEPVVAPDSDRPQYSHKMDLLYVKVAAVLVVLTAIEIYASYADFLDKAFLPLMLSLMATKFLLVVLFFMHLRWDSKLFGRMFWAGALLAVAVYVGALATFEYFAKA
jgi:cytochrome c oxidase subunit 4